MASIRELLPRLYMELALLRCYVFISKNEIKPALARITKMIRGIGNPLVAAYLRVYLCHTASKLLGKDSEEYFYGNLKEFLEEYQQVITNLFSFSKIAYVLYYYVLYWVNLSSLKVFHKELARASLSYARVYLRR